jgi:segregation and condensation protein B
LKAAGLLEGNLPPGFDMPLPKMSDELTEDEDPLDGTEVQQPLEMHMEELEVAPDLESSEQA